MATKSPHNHQQKHLAVLIDADNAQAAIVEGLFEEIAKYGIASVRRIYGDFRLVSSEVLVFDTKGVVWI
ncbi:hypothetical protein HX867_02285 [Pseudomonas gingeri]|nr:hypothetical protein [Pseudomonas gingeri]NVZ60902.1 hypothetical protein [Pseudomonas gingeri]NVZ78444.1 hypothetical protein [Pseudomonas gingeri]